MKVAKNSSHERADQCGICFHFSCYFYTGQSVFFPAITNPFQLSQLMDLLMHLVYIILSSIASLFFCKWGSSEALLIPTASQFQTKKLPLASGGLLPQWDIFSIIFWIGFRIWLDYLPKHMSNSFVSANSYFVYLLMFLSLIYLEPALYLLSSCLYLLIIGKIMRLVTIMECPQNYVIWL